MLSGQADLPRGNRILDALSPTARRRLAPLLTPVDLEMKEALLEPGKPIETVYFPLTAVVSLLTTLEEGALGVEVATIGNEGIVGISAFLGAKDVGARDTYQAQVPGQAMRMAAGDFVTAAAREPMRGLAQRYAQALFAQVSQQVACNGVHSIEERCSRWMLLTHDRVGIDEFPLTHEFLSQMLGVRRASVTVAAGILQRAGFIRYGRGRVAVVDREGLESVACECYHVIREEFDRLLPSPG